MSRGLVLAMLLSVLVAEQQTHVAIPDHSVSGIVKSVDRTRLVISRPGKVPVEMTFTVNASTQKEGDISAGAKVQVRYRGTRTQRWRRNSRRAPG